MSAPKDPKGGNTVQSDHKMVPPDTFVEIFNCNVKSHSESKGKDDDDDTQMRPFITLTYAQSIDGSIAAERGKPLLLSGKESMIMTHRLRALHDGIMIGVGTLIADNPSLTTRLVPGSHPRPIILDTSLRAPISRKIFSRKKGNLPIIVCSDQKKDQEFDHRKKTLVYYSRCCYY